MFWILAILHLVHGGQNAVPQVVVWPPVSLTCTAFNMDIQSYNNGNTAPFTADVNVILYDSSNTLLRSQLCKLTGINGCTVYNYNTPSPGTYHIKIIDSTSSEVYWTSSGFSVSQGSTLSFFSFSFSPSSPSAWQDFTTTVGLTDGCGVTFVNSVSLTLSATNGISGTLTATTSTGSATFSVYCQNSGANTIIATSGSASGNSTITILQDVISFTSLSPTPNLVTDTFQANMIVKASDGSTLTRGEFTLTLTISPATGTLTGTKTGNTSGRVLSISNLKVTSIGTYTLVASSTGLTSGTSVSFTIAAPALTTVSLSSNTASPSAYISFSLFVSLYDQSNNAWTTSSTVTITSSPSSISGTLSGSTTTGLATFSVYCTAPGSITITATSGTKSGTTTITCLSNQIKITSVTPTPVYTTSSFSLVAGVYSNDGNTLINAYGPFAISISLTTAGTMTGTLTGSTSGGTVTFSSLKITTDGTYTIQATNANMLTGYSSSLTITALALTTITITSSNSSPSANVLFSLTCTLKDQTSATWTSSTTLSLTATASFVGSNSVTTSSGSGSFSVYCPSSGSTTFTVTSGSVTGTITLSVLQDKLKIITITPAPSLTTDQFSITVGVYDNSGSVSITSYGPFTVTLGLSPSGTLSGTTSSSTSSGVASFSSISIATSGTYYITASATDMISATSTLSYTISSLILTTLTLSISPSSPSAYFAFTLTVTLKDQNSNLWVQSSSITLTYPSNFIGGTTATTSSGTSSFSLYSNAPGTFTISGQSGSVTGSLSVTILSDLIKITSFTPTPSLISDIFQVQVSVYDNSGTTLASTYGSFTINLALSPSGTIQGTISKSTTSAAATFSSLSISTPGTFTLTASSTDVISATTSSFTIQAWALSTITLTSDNSSPSAYFYFTLSVSLKDQGSNTWTTLTSITISATNGISGTVSQDVTGGSGTFSVYCSTSGSNTITATSGSVSGQLIISVLKNKLVISSLSPSPSYIVSEFGLLVTIYDNSGSTVLSSFGPFTISLSLNPSGTITGSSSVSSSSGVATFTGLKITTVGTFDLIASCTDKISDTYSSITIVPLALTTIQLSVSPTNPSAYFDFTVTALLYDQTNAAWTSSTSLTLTGAFVGGTSTVSASSGSGTFTIYKTTSGTFTVTCTSGSVSSTLSITVVSNRLVITSLSSTPVTTSSVFDVQVTVYDNGSANIESSRGSYSISLGLDPTGVISCGSSSGSSGVYNFYSCNIASSGTFSIQATGTDLITGSSGPYDISDPGIDSITISATPISQSTYFDIDVTVTIYDQGGNLYTSGQVSVSLSGTIQLYGSVSGLCDHVSSITLKVYCKAAGSNTITATVSGKSASTSVTIVSSVLNIDSITAVYSSLPEYPVDTFDCVIEGYDSTNSILSTYHDFIVTVSLTPSGTITGSLSITSSSGLSSFSSLIITTVGNYNLIFSAPGFTDVQSANIQISALSLNSVTLVLSDTTISAYKTFTATVTLLDQRSGLWTTSTSITISGDKSIGGTLVQTTTSGSQIFSIYGKASGTLTLTATASGLTASKSILIQQVHLIVSIVNTPSLWVTSSVFGASVSVYINDESVIVGTGDEFSISIELDPAGGLTGTLVETSSSCVSSYSGLKVTTNGTYRLKATCTDCYTGYSSSFTVNSLVLSTIELTSSTTTPSAYFYLTITATLKDQVSDLWSNSETVVLTDNSKFYGTNSVTASSGTCTYSIYFYSSGTYSLVASSSGVTGTITITVLKNSLKITSLSPTPTLTNSVFAVEVTIYNNEKSSILTENIGFTITLSLSNSGVFSGTVSGTSSNGIIEFSSLSITTSGSFQITASSTDKVSDTSATLNIAALVLTTMTAVPNVSWISANFPYTILITLKDQSGGLVYASTSLSLTSNLDINGDISISTSSGTITASVYSTIPGSNTITVTSGSVSTTCSITVEKNLLKIGSFSTTPKYPISVFSFQVTVYDYLGSSIESAHGPHSITLTLQTGTISGTTTKSTSSGIASFTSLSVTTPGTYTILASCTYCVSDTSASFTIEALVLNQIVVTSSNASPAAYEDFQLSIQLYDQAGQQWLTSTTLNLISPSSIQGTLTVTTATASASLTVYGTVSGTITITISSGSVSGSCSVDIQQLIILMTLITPIPKFTTSAFDSVVCVYKQDYTTLMSTRGTFDITLQTTDNSLKTTQYASTVNGCAYFYSSFISSTGSKYLKYTSSDLISGFSSELKIKSLSLTLVLSPSPVSTNFDISALVTIKDESNSLYIDLVDITLDAPSSSSVSSTSSTVSGSKTFTLHYTHSGSYSVQASAELYTVTTPITVLKNAIQVTQLIPTPKLQTDTFSVVIDVFDNDLIYQESIYGSYPIEIFLVPSGTMHGTLTATTTSGQYIFTGLSISTYGTMKICGSSSDLIQGCSSLFTLTEAYVQKIVIEISEINPTIYFDFIVTGYFYEQFGELYKGAINPVLTNSYNIKGTLSQSTSTGIATFPVYCTVEGINTLTLRSGSTYNMVNINLLNQRLTINNLVSVVEAYNKLAFQVKLYDNSVSVVQSKYSSFSITLESEPSGLTGTLTKTSASGIASFSGLYFTTPGEYYIKASCPQAILASQFINVTLGQGVEITISPPIESVSSKYINSFLITLFNKTSGTPVSFGTFELYINGSIYCELTTDANGDATFTTFFNYSGLSNIKVIYLSAESDTNVFIEDSNNTDALCIIATDADECSVCINLGVATNGICGCTTNAVYSTDTGLCTCLDGLFEYNQQCVSCKNYFQASELASYYSEDYKSIIVTFARPVKISALSGCADIIKGPEYFLSLYSACTWSTTQILNIALLSYPDLSYKTIQINEENVLAAESDCTLDKSSLNIRIDQKYSVPMPSVSITGPDTYSLICAKNSLILYSSAKGDSYEWTAVYSPVNSQVSQIVSSSKNNHVKIPPEYLTVGTLNIQLKLTITNLGWIIASKTISISNDAYLSVQISTGSVFYTKSSSSLKITALVKEQCDTKKDFTYLWSSPSSDTKVISVLSSSKTSKSLEFDSYILEPGNSYSFNVIVTQGSATGSASTLIIIKESSLEVKLDKSSGEYSLEEDFIVQGTATDPDNPSAVISYTWTCTQDSQTCKDPDNLDLYFVQDSGVLTIPRSELGSVTYTLYLYATSGSKSAYISIDVTFSENAIGSVSLPTLPNKLNPDYIYNIIPEITIGGYPTFLWTLSGQAVKNDLDYKSSYLGITENSLYQGGVYKLRLESNVNGKKSTRVFVDLVVNNGPACESVEIQYSSPSWTISANGCIDLDDTDYPLVYQFGALMKNNKEKWVTEAVHENIVQILLPSNSVQVKLRVCDSLETCNTNTTDLPTTMRRTEDTLMDIIQYTRESSNVPNAFLSYLTNDTQYSELLYLTEMLVQYFNELLSTNSNSTSITVNKYYIDLLFDCVKTVMELGTLPDSEILSNATGIIVKVLENYEKRIELDKIKDLLKDSQSYFETINKQIIVNALETLASHLVIDTIPGVIYNYSDTHTLLQTRKLALAFLGLTIKLDDLEIYFPKSIPVNTTDVYDFYFASIVLGDMIVIKSKMFSVGSFKSYNLEFTEKTSVDLNFAEPMIVILTNSINVSSAQCSDSDCKVLNVNSTHIQLELYSLVDTEVYDSGAICELARIPIQLAGILIFFAVILALVFYDRDKFDLFIPNDAFSFKNFYNFSSIFIKQKNPRRANSVFQILSSWLVILAIIGLSNQSFDEKISAFDVVVGVVTLKNFGSGLLALCFCQLLTLNNTILKLFRYTREKFEFYMIVINCSVSLLCFIIICVSASYNCQSSVVAWMTNFTIFVLVHTFIFEPIYAVVVLFGCRNQPMLRSRRGSLPSEVTSSKVMHFSYNGYQSADMPTPRTGDIIAPLNLDKSDIKDSEKPSPRTHDKSLTQSSERNSSRIIGTFTSRTNIFR